LKQRDCQRADRSGLSKQEELFFHKPFQNGNPSPLGVGGIFAAVERRESFFSITALGLFSSV
jgi:hypothetical protein